MMRPLVYELKKLAMNKTLKLAAVSTLAAGLLLSASPAFADHMGNADKDGTSENIGLHFGAFLNGSVMRGVGVGQFRNADKDPVASTTKTEKTPFPGTAEIGVVSSVTGSNVVLSSAINLSGTSTAPTSVVVNASTTFKGGATSTASLTSGEKVIIVGTSSTSTPGTITATIVIALQSAWDFCTHLFGK